jgi:hypothetical protein
VSEISVKGIYISEGKMTELSGKELRKEADRLGIPWTHVTTDAELLAMVESRKRSMTMEAVPQAQERGDFLYIDGQQQPDCFEEMWDGTEDDCAVSCVFVHHCLDRFARGPLTRALEKYGHDIGDLSLALGRPPEAIEMGLKHRATLKLDGEGSEEKPPVEMQEVPPPPDEPKPEKKTQSKKKPPKKQKAKKPPKKEKATDHPSKAEPGADRVAGSAKKQPEKSAATAKARAGAVTRHWGDPKTRWLRERENNKLIAMLVPTQTLVREYKGVRHHCKILKDGYEYQGQKFPTLYAVVKVITGTKTAKRQKGPDGTRPKGSRQLCSWSAPRFWKLKEHFADKVSRKIRRKS